ncbi:MAG: KH domain-containing protein [bacterium]
MTDAANITVDLDILKNLILNLVTVPDEVQIERKIDEQGVLLSVMVNSSDMGIVIGRNGSMASAIKTVMRAVGKANKMNVRVQFLEPDGSIRYSNKENYQAGHQDNDHQHGQSNSSNQSASTLDDDLKDFVIN